MNIVYLIGNGFDLNLGLKTSYSDFIKEYKASETGHLDAISKFKNDIATNTVLWSDLELEFGRYTENFSNIEELDLVRENLVDELAEYLRKAQGAFSVDKEQNNYQNIFSSHLFDPEKFLKDRDSQSLISFYKNHKLNKHFNYRIISFNYTHTIERILGSTNFSNTNSNINITRIDTAKDCQLRELIHVHGSIDEDMVLGVDNSAQIKNETLSELYDTQVQLVKSLCNEAMKHGVELQAERYIREADVICIFGSSIGETDQVWWDLIAEQLKTRDCRLIIFYYKQDYNKRHSYRQEPLKRKVLSSFFQENEIEDMLNKVHFSLNSNIFQFDK